MILIKELEKERLEDFFQYLHIHISENGTTGTNLYFPLSKAQSTLSDELKLKFTAGLSKEIGEDGWRKTWIAINQENQIIGHIDIRASAQLNSQHRVLLGMGVDVNFRRLKVGSQLLEFIIGYCRRIDGISWIDLEVMSNNIPARRLYEKIGFKPLSDIKDMFRIDNISYDYTTMTINVD